MCAPFLTCQRAISLASSHFSSATRFLNRREPMTLVRSPTISGRLLSSASTSSMPGIVGAMRGRVHAWGALAFRHLRDGADVRGSGAAAAADDVQPAVLDEFLKLRGERFGRFEIFVFFVRQAGVGIAGNARGSHLGQRADVVRHQIGTGGAVQADGEQIGVGDGGVEGVDGLAGEHGAPALDGAGDHHRDLDAQFALEVRGWRGGRL